MNKANACIYKSAIMEKICHNVRTPLFGISSSIEELTFLFKNNSEIRPFLKQLSKSTDILNIIVNDLEDLSLLGKNKLIFDKNIFTLSNLRLSVNQLVSEALDSNQIHLTWNSQIDEHSEIIADFNKIKRILYNIITTLIPYTQDGSLKIDIAKLKKHNIYLIQFIVQQRGEYIVQCLDHLLANELSQSLFQLNMNTEFDNSICEERPNLESLTLGISISHEISKRMMQEYPPQFQGIKIDKTDPLFELGNDVIFYIPFDENTIDENINKLIPLHNEPLTKINIHMNMSMNTNMNMNTIINRNMQSTILKRVLVVDDDEICKNAVIWYLRKFDVIYEAAQNGLECLMKIRELKASELYYDIIFMDCNMPEMDGFEATEKIQDMVNNGIIRNIPIIAITANVETADKNKCLDEGMSDYLSKPFTFDQMKQIMLKFLNVVPISS